MNDDSSSCAARSRLEIKRSLLKAALRRSVEGTPGPSPLETLLRINTVLERARSYDPEPIMNDVAARLSNGKHSSWSALEHVIIQTPGSSYLRAFNILAAASNQQQLIDTSTTPPTSVNFAPCLLQ
ncbi:MAG: hypothetical protein WC043_02420 [Pseudobdellovibrionaceae bacterium]